MKINNSIVSNSLTEKFPSGYPATLSLSNYVANCVGLEGVLACAGLFCPEFIEINGAIYRNENSNGIFTPFLKYGQDKKTLEMVNNVFCFSDFFLLAANEASEDEILVTEFANVLKHFWEQRLKELYPNRTFQFVLSEDGLYDEDGFCMTFFECID
jgi:hypothetical protein